MGYSHAEQMERHENAKGKRWTVVSHYGAETSKAAKKPDPERPGWYIWSTSEVEPDYYTVASRYDLGMTQGGQYKTRAAAERKAAELNRLDVQGPLDPEFKARRTLLKRLAPRYGSWMHEGSSEARWPVRPERYLVDGFDDGWHGEEWHQLVDTLEQVRDVLTGDMGHEVMRVIDLDTGKEIAFERKVTVEVAT